MKRAFLQRVAEEDVQQIVLYIAEDNLHAANAFRAAIEKARATLEDLPEIGSPRDSTGIAWSAGCLVSLWEVSNLDF